MKVENRLILVRVLAIGLAILLLAPQTPVMAVDDTQPPGIAAFSFSPTIVTTGAGTASIIVTAHLTDDVSGISTLETRPSQVYFRSPSGAQAAFAFFREPADRISGTMTNGIYRYTMILPQNSETGVWHLYYIRIWDNAGHQLLLYEDAMIARGFPTTFQVIGSFIFLPLLRK